MAHNKKEIMSIIGNYTGYNSIGNEMVQSYIQNQAQPQAMNQPVYSQVQVEEIRQKNEIRIIELLRKLQAKETEITESQTLIREQEIKLTDYQRIQGLAMQRLNEFQSQMEAAKELHLRQTNTIETLQGQVENREFDFPRATVKKPCACKDCQARRNQPRRLR